MTLHLKSIRDLHSMLSKKEISAVELCQHYLNRIDKYQPKLNAFITVTNEKALADAKRADERIASGQQGPLTGIPFAHKDIFCTQGVRTTCGSKMLDNFEAPYDATVVRKLAEAGVVLLGKLNQDEFAMGSSNETSFYGSVKNPWNLDYVPGGSSGGSAAAVAAGLTIGATGTDTGGSIRQPASLTGITGLKPSYGLVSRFGMIAFASSLDQGGPMARSVEDCALLLNAMVGFDEADSTSLNYQAPDYTAQLNDSLSGLRIGIPKEFFAEGLVPEVANIIRNATQWYEAQGAKLVEISLPNMSLSVPVYYIIASAECSSNLARYDGVRFGYRCADPVDLEDLYKRSRGEGFGEEVKRRIMIGTHVLSAGYFDAYYLKAQKVRRLMTEDFKKAFEKVDVIIGPTSPLPGFKLGEKTDNPMEMYLSDIYTIAVNLAGLPGISIPAGFAEGLPVGLQLIGPHLSEAKLLNVAHKFQRDTPWAKEFPKEFMD